MLPSKIHSHPISGYQMTIEFVLQDFPKTELTFEAWLSTSDTCHRSGIMSYAVDSSAKTQKEWTEDFNEFVVFDTANILACRCACTSLNQYTSQSVCPPSGRAAMFPLVMPQRQFHHYCFITNETLPCVLALQRLRVH